MTRRTALVPFLCFGSNSFFVSILYDYDVNNYKDSATEVKLSNTQSVYQDNLLENHYIAMETYKGLNLFGASQDTVQIFDDDVYTKPISFFTDRYYIVADYTENYTKNYTDNYPNKINFFYIS